MLNIILLLISIVISIEGNVESLPNFVRIGALFSRGQEEQELAFRYAIEHINNDPSLLPQTTLIAHVENLESADSFHAQQKVCGVLRNGVVAVFGPQDSIVSMHVQSICEAFEIPQIETRSDFESFRADLSLNLFPRPTLLAKVYIDLIKEWKWKSFAVIYEDNSGIVYFKDLFELSSVENWDIKSFQLMSGISYRDVLRRVKDNNCLNIILNVKTENIREFFRQALQSGILTENHKYLVINLDLHSIDMSQYKYSRAKITSFRFVDHNNSEVKQLLFKWTAFASDQGKRHFLSSPKHLLTESALIYDGIHLLAKALYDLNGQELNIQPILCTDSNPWPHGSTLLNYMRKHIFYGMTGLVKFDESGFRSDIMLEILSHTEQGFDVSGKWIAGKVEKFENWTIHYSPELHEKPLIRITSVFNDPFLMIKKSSLQLKDNDRYEGYVIDLVEELSKELNFRYTITPVKDRQWGGQDKVTGEWNGMVGEVMRGEADIAVADLTINSDREKAIDFTYPFMSTGITILYKKPTKVLSLWSFMLPFSSKLWIYMFAVLSFVGIIQVMVGRLSPYEWTNNYPCRTEEQVLENAYFASNSFWFSIGGIMQQGSDIAPKSLSTRVIGGVFFFFTLIIVSSYTANLAAFLTVEDVPYPFDNVESLASQTRVKYGCVENGATHRFFKSSNIPTYQKMATFMNQNRDVFKSSNAIGRDSVENGEGKYAFFMESATIEYITERYCNLTQIGGLLDSKGYGIATKKGSIYRTPLSEAILKLQETGVMRTLKERWWKQKYGGGSCLSKPTTTLLELGMKNVGGVFVILIGGSVFAIILAFYELFEKTWNETENKNTFWDDLKENLKFSLKISEYSKPLKSKNRKSLSRSKSHLSEKSHNISSNNLQTNYTDFY